MTTYVIRENSFFYGDDYDHLRGYQIVGHFQDRQQAEAVYKKLEVEAVQNIILCHQESLFSADPVFLKELDDFVFSCCGEHILFDSKVQMDLPESMNEDDIFEFIQRASIQKYQIFEFEQEACFYAIWLNSEQKWLYQNDGIDQQYLIYEGSIEQLLDYIYTYEYGVPFISQMEMIYKGKIEDLTDSPLLFNRILSELSEFMQQYIYYDQQKYQLVINYNIPTVIFALNAVLKNPIFEIRKISLEDVQQIEANFRMAYN